MLNRRHAVPLKRIIDLFLGLGNMQMNPHVQFPGPFDHT